MQTQFNSPKTFAQKLEALSLKFDDGAILRIAFYLLLMGTICVIGLDFYERQQAEAYTPQPASTQPILPPMVRTDKNPNTPALTPENEILTDPALLAEPMKMELLADGLLYLEGTISVGSAAQLLNELDARAEYIKSITLNSPGGIVDEAIMMGQIIRDGEFSTQVSAGHFCASSCPLVLAGGVTRTLDPKSVIGVHQIYSVEDASLRGPAQAMSDAQTTTAQIGRYLDDMGIDPKLWFHALETPPRQLYYLTADEMRDFKLSTPDDNATS